MIQIWQKNTIEKKNSSRDKVIDLVDYILNIDNACKNHGDIAAIANTKNDFDHVTNAKPVTIEHNVTDCVNANYVDKTLPTLKTLPALILSIRSTPSTLITIKVLTIIYAPRTTQMKLFCLLVTIMSPNQKYYQGVVLILTKHRRDIWEKKIFQAHSKNHFCGPKF